MLLGSSVAACGGVLALFLSTAWFLWVESLEAEEEEVGNLAEDVGQRTQRIIMGARETLAQLNDLAATVTPCSEDHLRAMDRATFSKPYVVAIGHWRGAERTCGVGFSAAVELKPPRADRIYDSGVIAWWPSPHTEVASVQLFLMRYGRHDVAIDPRLLLSAVPVRHRRIGLWVEGLRMASVPHGAELPAPGDFPNGLTVDHDQDLLKAHYQVGTLLPIDVVVTEPIRSVWIRHSSTFMVAALIGLLLAGAWIFAIFRYSRHRLSLAMELREALAAGRVKTLYQPIMDLSTGSCVGAEALARWTRDNGEEVSPETFIPLAEGAGLVSQITLAMLQDTLDRLGKGLLDAPEFHIHINLSAFDLESDHLISSMGERLAAAGVPPSRIKLEITERSLINSDKARALINAFRERGHRVAIDDFGTGYSSLAYLETFELDTLKIDKSFVDAIGTEAVTNNVIDHVIGMAQSLGLDIVAEGIETNEQSEWLQKRGVEFGQGFLFSRPLTARRFHAFVRAKQGTREAGRPAYDLSYEHGNTMGS